jgi:Asp-tRNA(Asn)/Glu-tRNA(Gln) amidotransferase B subunit
MTAEVMISPRKYGHAEGGVKSFVQTLANNLADKEKLEAVNSKCLSITNENMKAEVLGDLFKRIGAKDIWEHIGRQARILALFETRDATQATSKARTILDEFMRQRNQIAHPSATISWANPTQVKSYITFFRELCITLVEVSEIYKKPPPKPVVKVT